MQDVLAWLVPLLRCPRCRGTLERLSDVDNGDGILAHRGGTCNERFPIVDGIPRILGGPERVSVIQAHADWFSVNDSRREIAEEWRTAKPPRGDDIVRSFDFEWSRFSSAGTQEHEAVFPLYFDLVPAELFGPEQVVLDAGCGAGRWAFEVARRGPRVIAVDLGLSIEIAGENTRSTGRVALLQADLLGLPLAAGACDWAYSLGVLHHTQNPPVALRRIVDSIRPDGALLLYLYYALDNRGAAFRSLFRLVDVVRRVTSSMPRAATAAFASAIALIVYWPLARMSAMLSRAGAERAADALPLSFYRDRTLKTMRNDSLDRFGTRLERRYTRLQMEQLIHDAGGTEIVISPLKPYWHAWARTRGR